LRPPILLLTIIECDPYFKMLRGEKGELMGEVVLTKKNASQPKRLTRICFL